MGSHKWLTQSEGDRRSLIMVVKQKLGLPKLHWRRGTCEVCGESFDYLGKRQPHTCKNGDCLYKYRFKIEPDRWFSHQPTFFE